MNTRVSYVMLITFVFNLLLTISFKEQLPLYNSNISVIYKVNLFIFNNCYLQIIDYESRKPYSQYQIDQRYIILYFVVILFR